ncbi:small multidrug resistance pump [Klenkia soli]|uniref:Small multidrug resistance pump n=1 Tax=Klenkia soli TaxID=1052260 RepID=A0A1H0UD71_9ACTN|nr:SMR family transporter [Klenkia soli]SDP63955.1 small multidrug resistance pump [Klenkia soli]
MRPSPSALLLTGAVLTEVAGTLALRVSDGFTRWLPTTVTLVGYGVSLWLFSLLLHRGGVALGTAYATLTGAGLAAATLASVLLFRDPLTVVQLVGMAVLAAGVLVLQTGPRAS